MLNGDATDAADALTLRDISLALVRSAFLCPYLSWQVLAFFS